MKFVIGFPEGNLFRAEWEPGKCFAYQGVDRLGVIESYECGIFERINGWFDGLDLKYEVTPKLAGCMMHSHGQCFQEYHFAW